MKAKVLNYLGFFASGVLTVIVGIYAVRLIDKKFGTKAASASAPAPKQ